MTKKTTTDQSRALSKMPTMKSTTVLSAHEQHQLSLPSQLPLDLPIRFSPAC